MRWTLLELGIPFESIEGRGREIFAMPELAQIHPMSKLPALRDSGRPLFESAAICTWLADSHPQAGLIAPSGTWARALHDQPLGGRARPGGLRTERQGSKARPGRLRRRLQDKTWLVEDHFSVTDIFVGYAAVWARVQGMTAHLPNVTAYAERILARPLCPYGAMG